MNGEGFGERSGYCRLVLRSVVKVKEGHSEIRWGRSDQFDGARLCWTAPARYVAPRLRGATDNTSFQLLLVYPTAIDSLYCAKVHK